MANPEMLKANYWYGDEDVNAVLAAVREKITNPLADGTHVTILDAVCAEGVQDQGIDARNLEWNLNKHSRLADTDYLTILDHILRELESITPEHVATFMETNYLAQSEAVKQKVVARLHFSEGQTELTAERKKILQGNVAKEVKQAAGTDPFDDISELLKKSDSKFSILFPYNVGGKHWVLGEINIKRTGNNVTVKFTKDCSLGQGGFSSAEFDRFKITVESRLKDILVGDTFVFQSENVSNASVVTQSDGSSCGPITLDNLARRLEGKSVSTDKFPAGAEVLRRQQYDLANGQKAETKLPLPKAADKNGKWDQHTIQAVRKTFAEKIKDSSKAKLSDDGTINIWDLSPEHLDACFLAIKATIEAHGLKGELEIINVSPASKRPLLEELCKKHKLPFVSNIKEEAVEETPSRSVGPGATG